ncbi:MAG: UDP-N-acetylmuramoyl-L-alanyl-D-glutamate--2,6-diaminopimelate ligase [Candidatus Omnitrophota bacterium]
MVEGKVVFANVSVLETRGSIPSELKALVCDSRQAAPDSLFVALKGAAFDGHDYIPEAAAKGAAAAVVQEWREPISLPQIRVADTLAALPRLAANFYGHPAKELHITGVTGSNGKTTTTHLLEQIWKAAGEEAAVIGTIEYRFKGGRIDAPNTTPLPHELQQLLRRIADAGNKRLAMEVSSHGLALHRVDEIEFDAAIFCNLSQDHLDFHKTMEEYWRAKLRLFTDYLKPDGSAVLNRDDESGRRIEQTLTRRRITTFAIDGEADVRALDVRLLLDGVRFRLRFPGGEECEIHTPLLGRHNVENILGAAAAAYACGVSPEAIRLGAETLAAVPGRLQSIPNGVGAQVVVDYCHTPDALEKCLAALAALPHKRIVTLFGCGGDRDAGKRPIMGEIALRRSDFVIVTDDNPRTEDPKKIIQDIEKGMAWARDRYIIVPNRREAIAAAVAKLQTGDILLLAGKGHETYQLIGRVKHPFDDREAARQCLLEAGKGA